MQVFLWDSCREENHGEMPVLKSGKVSLRPSQKLPQHSRPESLSPLGVVGIFQYVPSYMQKLMLVFKLSVP